MKDVLKEIFEDNFMRWMVGITGFLILLIMSVSFFIQ